MKRRDKPWMRPRTDKAPRPSYETLAQRLGDLISLCHRWRVYGVELMHAEHDYNRVLSTKSAKSPAPHQTGLIAVALVLAGLALGGCSATTGVAYNDAGAHWAPIYGADPGAHWKVAY